MERRPPSGITLTMAKATNVVEQEADTAPKPSGKTAESTTSKEPKPKPDAERSSSETEQKAGEYAANLGLLLADKAGGKPKGQGPLRMGPTPNLLPEETGGDLFSELANWSLLGWQVEKNEFYRRRYGLTPPAIFSTMRLDVEAPGRADHCSVQRLLRPQSLS